MVLLLNPPGQELHTRSSRWGGRKNRSGALAPPIFLATATSVLHQAGLEARFLDAAALNYSGEELEALLLRDRPRIVVMEVSTPSIQQDYSAALFIKERLKDVAIVFVGPHVTALPKETLMNYPVDYLCIGEYEFTLLELSRAILEGRDKSSILGIAYRENSQVVTTPQRPLKPFDELPMPLYEQMPLDKYYDPITRQRVCVAVRTIRGCPFRCTFCVAPQVMYNRTVRYKSPEKVVDEIEYLKKHFGVKEIFFDDETFTINKKHVLGICNELKNRNIHVEWSCFGRCNLVDEALLREMKAAGCYMIRYGVESAEQKILDGIQKGMKVEDIVKAFSLTKKVGMKTHATVLLGYLGETKESMAKTLKFVKDLDADYAQFAIATPYPGTEFYEEVKAQNRLLTSRWTEYDGTCNSVVRLDGINQKDLKDFVDFAYKDFYLRPSYILKRLLSTRTPSEVYHLLKSGLGVLQS